MEIGGGGRVVGVVGWVGGGGGLSLSEPLAAGIRMKSDQFWWRRSSAVAADKLWDLEELKRQHR